MEEGVASPLSAAAWSRREDTIYDLHVVLIGRCYGHAPEDRLLTEQEYDTAGLARIDRLVFLTEASYPAIVAEEIEAKHQAVERLRAKVADDVVYDRVASPADFGARVV